MSTFKKATRKQAKLRLALIGPSGSGKTMSALLIGKHLGSRIAVIDSECGSASKYAGDAADFDVLELDSFAPQKYVDAIRAAEREGYDVIVVDSLSHAWSGRGGALEMKDAATKRSKSGNSFDAWRDVTPHHNALVDAMVSCKAHLIVTMRSKTEYVLEENDRGKKVPRKVGMAPIQRDGLEYEFDVVAELDLEHNFVVTKTRCSALDGAVVSKPGKQVAETVRAWLSDGAVPELTQPMVSEISGLSDSTPEEAAAVARLREQRDAAVAQVQRIIPELRTEEQLAATPTKAQMIAELLDVDMPQCKTHDHFVALARELISLHGPVRGTAEWKRFSEACASREIAPRDAVNAATKAA